jgi:hypothetical protein
MRSAVLLVCLAACTRTPGLKGPVVDVPPAVLAMTSPQLTRGEEMQWDVWWQGMQVGSVELVTGATDVRASFRTGTLARMLTRVRYDLTTVIDHGHARATTEVLVRGSENRRVDADLGASSFTLQGQVPRRTPDGQPLHTLASALGVLRAWSQATAPQGYLWLLHGGELYRLDVFPPVTDEALGKKALRIDAVVRAFDRSTTLDVSVWLARNRDRTPLRFVVEEGGDRVSAELVETTAAFD